MMHRNAWLPVLTEAEYQVLSEIPKAVLYVVARQFAALLEGRCDEQGSAAQVIYGEWRAQHRAGNVPQRPPKRLTAMLEKAA